MSMSDRYRLAHEKYFSTNPKEVADIESVNPKMLENLGITFEEWCVNQRYLAFSKAAEAYGMREDEFVIHLMAESPQQAQAWRLENHRRIADTLNIPWDEYLRLNGLSEH